MSLDFSNCDLRDDDLSKLDKKREVVELRLHGTHISDDSLRVIGTLTDLRVLDLSVTKITDDGLRELKPLTRLESFAIGPSENLSDAGVNHLTNLRGLRRLWYEASQLTDDGLQQIAQSFPAIELLDVNGGEVTERGITFLQALLHLRELRSTFDLNDPGALAASLLPAIEVLHCAIGDVSEESMISLCKAPGLKELNVVGGVSPAATALLKRLQEQFPHVQIYIKGSPAASL